MYRDYAEESRSLEGFEGWLRQWVLELPDRASYMKRVDVEAIRIEHHRPSVPADFGYE